MSEHFKHLPHILAGENEEMYDIEGNLDIETSLSKSNSSSSPAPIVVETVEVDEFEEQDTGNVSVVFMDDETTTPSPNIDICSNERFTFIPYDPTIDNDDDLPINPIPPKKVSFVPTFDGFVPCKDPVVTNEFPHRKRTNKHYSSHTPRPVNRFPPPLPVAVSDVELMPPIVVPLTNGREEVSNEQVNTAEVDVFTQDIYFDSLQNWDTHINTSDGSDILTFGQHTFSTDNPSVYFDQPSQGSIEQHGHHQLYTHTSGADIHVYMSESDDDGYLVSDHRFWSNFFTPNISRHIYHGVIDYSVTLGVNELDIVDQLPVKPRETRPTQMDHEAMKPFFAYLPTSRIKKSFETCFHKMRRPSSGNLRQRHKSPSPAVNFYHHSEIDCTDIIFGDVPAVDNGATGS